MIWHSASEKAVLGELSVTQQHGLSEQDVQKRRAQYGENRLAQKRKKGILKRFFEQFQDFLILILLAAAAVSFGISVLNGDADFVDPIIILVIVVMNATIGVIQEEKAEKSLEALQKICAPLALVRRGGQVVQCPSSQVCVGDILILRTGAQIPADCRLLSSVNLQTDESGLTGESTPVLKDASCVLPKETPLADRKNMALSSSTVVSGHGEAVVTAVGMQTEMGRIAQLILNTESKETPLQRRLGEVSKVLGIFALIICAVIFIIGLFRQIPPFEMFMISVSLAVAAIPEGLPAIVTIMLAIGVTKMAKSGAIIRNIPSVETLGSASVICSDKTGTLTQNTMKVTTMHAPDPLQVLTLATLCCDPPEVSQNPTEQAILTSAKEHGIEKTKLDQLHPRLSERPFDSKRKMMSTCHTYNGGKRIVVKGAPDVLLRCCTKIDTGKNIEPLTENKKQSLLAENNRMADDALRVLAVAYKDTTTTKITEENLVFLGLIGIMDPPRPEVTAAVSACKTAGIRPVMITGDHARTAKAIATKIGITTPDTPVLTGTQLEAMSQAELENSITAYSVFARVTPEHKVRIVKAWQKHGAIVAMTGDGINDAPALKTADIGCSMGKSGTDVAKNASDMILTDDNFATIVEAVRQGRSIFSNIKKAIQFLLSSNIGEIMTIFVGLLFGWQSPLLPIQLLWVNLVTDSLPAIALGVDPADAHIMKEPPRPANKSLFADGLWASILLEGAMIGALALLAFSIGWNIFDTTETPYIGRTMAFSVLSLSQLVHAFNMRSTRSVFSAGIFKNIYLVYAFLTGLLLQIGVVTVPPLARLFRVVPLSLTQWSLVGALSIAPLVIVELEKLLSKGWGNP